MRKLKIYFILIALASMVGYFGYKYLYHEHRDINAETSVIETTAQQLSEAYQANGQNTFLNKTVTITGKVTDTDANTITLDDSVHCTFESDISEIKHNTQVTIKGRCIGYDDLFELVKIDQSTILKQ
ncbi:MAG: OB-fold putative lipoprotein [Altibacter sp.]|uniref:OB-fold protein n=1 Tax=Altibacter sp. TaxID=2024823 RepID=UPI001DFF9CBE|nr:hypothetical protein [Altibacter sp.]MBZ0327060.1 OB-fold putative lipoprotein [Altibacter sp.]